MPAHALNNYLTVTGGTVELLLSSLADHPDPQIRTWLEELHRTNSLTLQPQTRRVVVFSGTTTTDTYSRTLAWSQFRDYEGKLEFIDLGSLPIPELLERVAHLLKDTIILPTFFRNSAGRSFIPQRAVSLVAQTANAPIYAVYETLLGYGAVLASLEGLVAVMECEARSAIAHAHRQPAA